MLAACNSESTTCNSNSTSRMKDICPLMFGKSNVGSNRVFEVSLDLFSDGILDNISTLIPTASADKAIQLLKANNLQPGSLSESWSTKTAVTLSSSSSSSSSSS